MSTVIDELVLAFSLDASRFTSGQRKVLDQIRQLQESSRRGAKDTEEAASRITRGFTSLKREALGIIGLFAGGMGAKQFIEHIVTMDASTGRTAKTLNMATKELSIWQNAARMGGSSAEAIAGSMQGLTDQMQRLQSGMGDASFIALLNSLHISAKDENGWKTAGQIFREINHAVQGMDPAQARVRLMALGMDPSTVNFILQNESALSKLLATADKMGPATEADAKAAQELAQGFNAIQEAAEGAGRSILRDGGVIAGTFNDIANAVAAFNKGNYMEALGILWRTPEATAAADRRRGGAVSSAPTASFSDRFGFGSANASTGGMTAQERNNLGLILRDESGGQNKMNYIGDAQHTAQGYYQITNTNWRRLAPGLGISAGNAMAASFEDQTKVALALMRESGTGNWANFNPKLKAALARGDSATFPGMPPGAAAAAAIGAGVGGGSTSNTSQTATTHIGEVNVNAPRATDASGIASGIGDALRRASLAAPANFGQQ